MVAGVPVGSGPYIRAQAVKLKGKHNARLEAIRW